MLDALAVEIDACTAEVRELIDGLRPAALDDGLEVALHALVERFAGPEAKATLDVDGELGGLPAAVEVAAYRVATEALTNVVKHAGARHATLVVRRDERHLEVRVTDDGRGIPPGSTGTEGVGLSSIRSRADELGGRCEITSGPAGTSVTVLLPLAA
jgi:signal transduction histidine kinase